MTKKHLSVSFQLFEWYDLILGSFVKLPNLAKCPNPSWSFGQLQAAWRGWGANCRLHPLIHTLLKFALVQNIVVFQRFAGLGNSLPQTGHTFSVGLTMRLVLHLEHLTGWSLARSISTASRLVIRFSESERSCSGGLKQAVSGYLWLQSQQKRYSSPLDQEICT
jgi:hypothetical protein